MRTTVYILGALLGAVLLPACHTDPVSKIPAAEQALDAGYSAGKADTLVQLYLAAIAAHPDKPADNLHYAAKAAEIKFFRNKDAVGAVRLINGALKDYGKDQNLTEPVGVLVRIGHSYIYGSTPDLSREPDDIDLMQANLKSNPRWIDSALVRLDKEMGSPVVTDNAKATVFIETAETYAALIQGSQTDKQVDLLLKAAGLAKTIGNANKAVQLYYNVAEKIQNHPKAPTALFMMAFVYENDIHDLDKAKAAYETFLKRYPNDPDYADDAQNALKLLGKSAEEIIKEFEKNPQ